MPLLLSRRMTVRKVLSSPISLKLPRKRRVGGGGGLINVLDKPHLDLTTPLGRGFIAFLSAMAAGERHRILNRTNDGPASARKRGGRQPKLTNHQQVEALKRLAAEIRRQLASDYRQYPIDARICPDPWWRKSEFTGG